MTSCGCMSFYVCFAMKIIDKCDFFIVHGLLWVGEIPLWVYVVYEMFFCGIMSYVTLLNNVNH